jgi:hypothetical protein
MERLIATTCSALRTPCSLATLLETRQQLQREMPARLSDRHRQFLAGLARARPDWSLLECPHAADLPALRWKLNNLETFRQRRAADFDAHANALEARFTAL